MYLSTPGTVVVTQLLILQWFTPYKLTLWMVQLPILVLP